MRIFVLFIISILNISLQSSMPNYLDLDILPNTSLILVVCYGYLRTDFEGALYGLAVGLMQDIMFSEYIGYFALIYFLVGFVTSHMLKHFMNSNAIPIFLLNIIGTFMYSIMIYFFTFFFRGRLDFIQYMYNITLKEAIANAILSIPVFYFMYFIDNKLNKREQRTTKYLTSFKPNNKL